MKNIEQGILLGTTNDEKVKEFFDSKRFEGIRLYTLGDFSFPDIEETGETLKENALLKARYYFEQTGIPTISDDSGLFINALNGFPGIHSARFVLDRNIEKAKEIITEKLKDFPDKSAVFSTALVYVDSEESIVVQSDVPGTYVYKLFPSSIDKFGYRDAFLPDGSDKTIADMNPQEKFVFSPRSRALIELINQTSKLCNYESRVLDFCNIAI